MFKPEFFEYLKKTRDAEMGVSDVKAWLGRTGSFGWSKEDMELHLTAILPHLGSRDIMSACFSSPTSSLTDALLKGRPPPTHRSFSHLPYNPPNSQTSRAAELNEDDKGESQADKILPDSPPRMRGLQAPNLPPPPDDFWRLEDDIEEF
jgi:cell cycle checkpoint protein